MDILQRKLLIKKKKSLVRAINQAYSLDELSIEPKGNLNDEFFVKIKDSLYESFSLKRKLKSELFKIKGLSGRKYRRLINYLIGKFEKIKYLEIGSWLGSTACSACFENNIHMTCIDNWSENFDKNFNPKEECKRNIKTFLNSSSTYKIIEKDFERVDYSKIGKHKIYFFDGPHTFEDHFKAVRLVQPALEDKHILIIDDWNWDQVRGATIEAIDSLKLNIISQLEIRTTLDGTSSLFIGEDSDWHQGYGFFVIQK